MSAIVDRDPGDENDARPESSVSTGLCAFGWCDDEAAPDSDLCPACIAELELEPTDD